MYEKICPHCGGSSFSASDQGEWICPYCGQDLSHKLNRLREVQNIKKDPEFLYSGSS